MKHIILLLLVPLFFACTSKSKDQAAHDHQHHQSAETASDSQKPKSPRTASMAMVSDNHIHIDYSAPSVRGRQIFGGLVAFDEIWVTGAHMATNISFDRAVTIGTTQVPPGKYGFFTIPGKEKWTIILNRQWDMHLADKYQASEDILRLEVRPEILSEPVEVLTYKVETKGDNSAEISMSWADVRIAFEVTNR